MKLFPGCDILGIKASNEREYIEALRRGLSVEVVDEIAKRYRLTTEDLAAVISRRTLQRRRAEGQPLSREESERLNRLVRLLLRMEETLGSPEKAGAWICRPLALLQGERPVDYIDTDQRVNPVLNLPGRIAHGIYS